MRIRYENRRTVVLLSGPVRLRLKVRRCEREGCARHRVAYRPEAEGAIALAQHEFGLDVVALVGTLRHHGHRSGPEIHAALRGRGVEISERSVTNLLDRYDELLAVSLTDGRRLRTVLAKQGRAILALDGMQPDGGHEVLWVVRECLSGEVLLARSLLSGTAGDLAPLLRVVADAIGVPVEGLARVLRVLPPGDRLRRWSATARPRSGGWWRLRCPGWRTSCASSTCLPRGGKPGLRGGPPRQEGAEEAGARGAPDRAGGRGPR